MSQKMLSNETIRKAIENMRPIPKTGQGDDFGDLSSFIISKKIAGLLNKFYILIEVKQN